MESKFSALISNIKNMNSEKIFDALKKNRENLTPQAMMGLARKTVDTAKSFSKEEIQFLLGKINAVGNKTNFEIEKNITKLVNKLLDGQSDEIVTEEVRKEIINILLEQNGGNNLIPTVNVKYVNSVVVNNAPTSIEAFKNFRKNIAQTLIIDAKKRISNRNIIDAQVVSEQPDKKHPKKERNINKSRESI